MPHKKKTHEDMRLSVCGICWLKPKGLQKMTERILAQVNDFVNESYKSEEDECWLPKVICDGCRKSLRKKVMGFII